MANGDPLYDANGDPLYDSNGDPLYESDDCCYRKLKKCSDDSATAFTIRKSAVPGSSPNTVFKRAADSVCYYLGDATPCPGTDAGSGTWFASCVACEGDGPVPCDIDCTALASSYSITSMVSAAACATCSVFTPNAAWAGDFVKKLGFPNCWWVAPGTFAAPESLGGPGGEAITDQYVSIVVANFGGTCIWFMTIACNSDTIWMGVKMTGPSPAGVYTRVSGCDTSPTLTVV